MSQYSPRSANGSKAAANWERKSQHLLAEVVKYQTYIDILTIAIKLRGLKRGQKEVEMMLREADTALDDDEDLAMISPTDGPRAPLFAVPSSPSPPLPASRENSEDDGVASTTTTSIAASPAAAAAAAGSNSSLSAEPVAISRGHSAKPSVSSITTDGEEQEFLDA